MIKLYFDYQKNIFRVYRSNYLYYIILILSISIPVIIFKGSIDPFAPMQISVIEDIINKGHIMENYYTNQIPGFYIFGSILALVNGILPPYDLLFLPVQIFLMVAILYVLFYKISRHKIISALAVLMFLISGIAGTANVFLWPHGIGNILFYLLVFILLNILYKREKVKWHFILILICVQIIFMSYDLAALALIFLSVIPILIFFLLKIAKDKYRILDGFNKNFMNLILILLVIEFGISKFFYNVFLPTFKNFTVEISALDKFIASYMTFFQSTNTTTFQDILLSYPAEISIIAAIKYLILIISLIISINLIIKKLFYKKKIYFFDLIVIGTFLAYFLWGLIRFLIGQIPVTTIFYMPAVFCTLWLCRKNYKKLSFSIIIIVLILNGSYYFAHSYYDLINNKIDDQIYTFQDAESWLDKKSNENCIKLSDILTRNLFVMVRMNPDDKISRYNSLRIEDFEAVLGDPTYDIRNNVYYIANNALSFISLTNWVDLKPWRFFQSRINSNTKLNRIYDNRVINVFSS